MARLARLLLLTALSLAAAALPAAAQEATLGGGSDVSADAVVSLPAGASIAAIHHVFADNRESAPIEVQFHAESPAGIEIVPEHARMTIPPGESAKDQFGIRVDDAVPPGDHRVTVQLIRADIVEDPAAVTNIPAIGVSFTVRVVGDAATIDVRSVSAESGRPVDGTLTLTAVDDASSFEVARAEGSALTQTVAPGAYEAAYLLAGRELARERVQVAAGDTAEVVLEVDTVSFVMVAATPVTEGRRVILADLLASVENHLGDLDGDVQIRAMVYRGADLVDEVIIDEREGLPVGITEAKLAYRPQDGFPAGSYRFRFELVTEEFTASAADEPGFEVVAAFPLWRAAGMALALTVSAGGFWLMWRNRHGLHRPRTNRDRGALRRRAGAAPA